MNEKMEMIKEKTLAAELSLLGAALLDSERLAEIVPANQSLFMDPDLGKAFWAVVELYSDGKGVDPLTVAQALQDSPSSGGSWLSLLNTAFTNTATATNISYYNDFVVDAGLKRRMKSEIFKKSSEIDGQEFSSAKSSIIGAIELIGENAEDSSGFSDLSKCGQYFMSEIDAKIDGLINPFSSGFNSIDERLGGGFEGGDLIIVAGRPGMGKTALTMNLAAEMSRTGPVAYYSLEMRKNKLMARMCSAYGGMSLNFSKNPRLYTDEQKDRESDAISRAFSKTQEMQLLICDDSRTTIHQMKSQCRKLKRSKGLRAIFIDYLELMNGLGEAGQRLDQVLNEYTKQLKGLANELNIPVFLLAQLNRECEKRPDKRPLVSDLKNCGGIEQDADTVILMYRDDYYKPDSSDKGICELDFKKLRQGEPGVVPMAFDTRRQKFEDLSHDNIVRIDQAKKAAYEDTKKPFKGGFR